LKRILAGGGMNDWNVVVSVFEHGFRRACRLLETIGPVRKTDYFNVLVMKVDDAEEFLRTLKEWLVRDPEIFTRYISRAVPLTVLFGFQTPAEFETKAQEAAARWLPDLAGARFHVRMHRRGFAGRMSSQNEERFLDEFLLKGLEQAGTPGSIGFDDPEAILAVETVGQRAGLSLWTRAQWQTCPFLGLD
jgi:tRNA(Ser,Leu) C12 N-acetylase TAN1